MHTKGIVLLALAVLASAESAEELARKAKEEADGGAEAWKAFALSDEPVPDADLEALADRYDRAIALYQKAEEEGFDGVGAAIVSLARRAVKLRAQLFWRDQKRRREAAAAKAPASKPDARPAERPETTTPESRPVEGDAAGDTPAAEPAPPILETRAQRSRGIQSARNFLMSYFRHRKAQNLRMRCAKCNGRGKIPFPRMDPRVPARPPMICQVCGGKGAHLNEDQARRAFWLCWSPLFRQNSDEWKRWQKNLEAWRSDPWSVPTLKRLRIKSVDYHGLWADVKWEETASKKRRDVGARLIRIGRQWHLYHESYDAALFTADGSDAE